MNDSSVTLSEKKQSPSKLRLKSLMMITFILVFIGTAVSAGYFYWQYRELSKTTSDSEKEVAELVKTVGKLMELPTDETPNLATVTDVEKLKNQQFFIRAENGDKLLFYLKRGKVIMYRPSINKIIDVTEIKATSKTEAEPTSESKK